MEPPRQIIITSSESPDTIGVDHNAGPLSVVATPAGAGNYDVEFTCEPIDDTTITPNFFPIAAMTAATTQQQVKLGSISGIRITLNSGTSVTLGLTQSAV